MSLRLAQMAALARLDVRGHVANRVLAAIAARSRDSGKGARMSLRKLAERQGIKREYVGAAVNALAEGSVLEVSGGARRLTEFTINVDVLVSWTHESCRPRREAEEEWDGLDRLMWETPFTPPKARRAGNPKRKSRVATIPSSGPHAGASAESRADRQLDPTRGPEVDPTRGPVGESDRAKTGPHAGASCSERPPASGPHAGASGPNRLDPTRGPGVDPTRGPGVDPTRGPGTNRYYQPVPTTGPVSLSVAPEPTDLEAIDGMIAAANARLFAEGVKPKFIAGRIAAELNAVGVGRPGLGVPGGSRTPGSPWNREAVMKRLRQAIVGKAANEVIEFWREIRAERGLDEDLSVAEGRRALEVRLMPAAESEERKRKAVEFIKTAMRNALADDFTSRTGQATLASICASNRALARLNAMTPQPAKGPRAQYGLGGARSVAGHVPPRSEWKDHGLSFDMPDSMKGQK